MGSQKQVDRNDMGPVTKDRGSRKSGKQQHKILLPYAIDLTTPTISIAKIKNTIVRSDALEQCLHHHIRVKSFHISGF